MTEPVTYEIFQNIGENILFFSQLLVVHEFCLCIWSCIKDPVLENDFSFSDHNVFVLAFFVDFPSF